MAETLFAPLLPLTTASQQQAPALEERHHPAQGDALRPCGMALYRSVPAGKNPFESEPPVQQHAARKPCPVPTRTREPAQPRPQAPEAASPALPRDRGVAERAAQTVLAAGKAQYEKGLYREAIAVCQAGLFILNGWENTTAWADLHIQLATASYQAGIEALDPDDKRKYWTEARRSFDAADLIYRHNLSSDKLWKNHEERRQEKVWRDLADRRDAVDRALNGSYRPAFYIAPEAVDDSAEGSGSFRWSRVEQAIATLNQRRGSMKAGETQLFEQLVAGVPSNATGMMLSGDARMANSGPHQAYIEAAQRLATVLSDPSIEAAILQGGKAQKRRAATVLEAYQALATTDSAMAALNWAKGLLDQSDSKLYRAFSGLTPDLRTALETTILQPALPAIEAAYDESAKSRYVNPALERGKIVANVSVATLRAMVFKRDLPNQLALILDPRPAKVRVGGYFGRAAWPIKANWTWGQIGTLWEGKEQLKDGELLNGGRYVLPALSGLITFIPAWSHSFPIDSEFSGLRRLVEGKRPDREGTLLADIFSPKGEGGIFRKLTSFIRKRLAFWIQKMSNAVVGNRQDLYLKRIDALESNLVKLAVKLNANPILRPLTSLVVKYESAVVGIGVDVIAATEHLEHRDTSIANISSGVGDLMGIGANLATLAANRDQNSEALKARARWHMVYIGIVVQIMQLLGEFVENLVNQTSEKSERIYPEHPMRGFGILAGMERESAVLDDSRADWVKALSSIKGNADDLLYQLMGHMAELAAILAD